MAEVIDNINEFLKQSQNIRYTACMLRIAFSYTRFSTLQQEQGDSERRQIESARQYATEHGYVLDESIAVDRGKSAFTGKNISEGALGDFSSVSKRSRSQRIRSCSSNRQIVSAASGSPKHFRLTSEYFQPESKFISSAFAMFRSLSIPSPTCCEWGLRLIALI
jgi:hypothetical protein